MDATDPPGNAATGRTVTGQDGEPLTLTIDSTPPALDDSVGLTFGQAQFGLADDGATFSFDFALVESNPPLLSTSEDGGCAGVYDAHREKLFMTAGEKGGDESWYGEWSAGERPAHIFEVRYRLPADAHEQCF